MKKLILLIFITLNIVKADGDLPAAIIKNIGTGWGQQGLYISVNNSTVIEGCTNPRVYISPSNKMYNDILSIALSSFHSSTKVVFRISGCKGSNMNAVAILISK